MNNKILEKEQLSPSRGTNRQLAVEGVCPECGSDLIYDFGKKLACDECNHVWRPEYQLPEIVPGEIRTYTGRMVNIFKPAPELISIEDIAHALSNLCRFNGHTVKFYSVAEHSLKCAELVPEQHKLAALLHDASEAYLVDLPSPIKIAMPEYINIEDKLMRVIAGKFGFEYPLRPEVKSADKTWLSLEWDNLMIDDYWETLAPADAKALFLETFDKLTNR